MQIQIKVDADESLDSFIYQYLPDYIYRQFINRLDPRRLVLYDNSYNINSFDILRYALKHLLITKVRNDTYLIKLDKTLKYDNRNLMDYVILITYGTRQIRGYSIILDIFRDVTSNISEIYRAWVLGID